MESLYKVDQAIEQLCCQVNLETGEPIYDEAELDALLAKREEAIEELALMAKNLNAEAEICKSEIKRLARKQKRAEKSAENCKRYLAYALHGEKLKTGAVSVSYRKTERVETDEHFVQWAQDFDDSFLNYGKPQPNLSKIKQLIKSGEQVPFAKLVENTSVIIR